MKTHSAIVIYFPGLDMKCEMGGWRESKDSLSASAVGMYW